MTIGLIDGDVLAYRAAAACQTNFDWDGDGSVVSDADAKQAIVRVRNLEESWRQAAGVDECVIFQSDRRAPKTSFRYHVHPHYKAQRSGVKPVVLFEVEEWLRKWRDATYMPGLEGDDALGIAATGEYKGRGVIISTDKDMRTIPGRCFIVPHMRGLDEAEVETITKKEAVRNTVLQAIIGDTVDNYKGAPGIGAGKAQKYVEEHSYIADALGAAFSDAYASEKRRAKFVCGHPQQEALMNWRCARILQTGDYEDGKVRLDNPFGADTWINPF